MTNSNPAYLIASSIMPNNHGSLIPYFEAAHPLLKKAGVELLVAGEAGQSMEYLEGNWIKDASISIFKFPSMDALLDFWNSSEYQAIKHLRTDVIRPNFTFAVEGYSEEGYESKLDD